MVGGLRNVVSRYRRPRNAAEGSERDRGTGRGRGRGRGQGRKGPPSTLPESSSSSSSEEEHEEEEQAEHGEEEQAEEEQAEHGEEQQDDEQEEQEGGEDGGSASTGAASAAWLRGPSKLPVRPIPLEQRPIVRPVGTRSWRSVVAGKKDTRLVNGILSLLCKEHFPGLVEFAGRMEPAYTWEHYTVVPDLPDRDGRVFNNKAHRVTSELWDFFRCQEGYEAKAAEVAHKACYKLVKDIHYEARVQAIVTYYAHHRQERITKKDARNVFLTKEEYMQVPPYWCAQHLQCWEIFVDKWCSPERMAKHMECRERRLMMPGPPHHQGNLSLEEYAARWSSSHDGQECSQLMAYAMSHKGKATSDVSYSPTDPAEAYSNASIHRRLTEYSDMARQIHGPDYDPTTQPLDGEAVMRAGGGKKKGRYWIGDSVLDTAATPTLSQIRARSTSSSPAIRPRPETALSQVASLQTQLLEEKRLREEMEARMEADRQSAEADRQRAEADRQQMRVMFEWIQMVGKNLGQPPPAFLAPPPPPVDRSFNQSAASNDSPVPGHGSSPVP